MGYSHADSLSLTRAVMLVGAHGFYRRRFDLFSIQRDASQSWWIVPLGGFVMYEPVPVCKR
ncbi:MAG: hypothetical protein ACI8PT_002609 [Gammaproteobacteria bacterium]|jgi:hypothetical protein